MLRWKPQLTIDFFQRSTVGEVVVQELFTSETAATAIAFITLFVCGTIIALGCTIAVQWRKARQAELSAALKKEMIERGMSAQDIQMVIRASGQSAEESTSPIKSSFKSLD